MAAITNIVIVKKHDVGQRIDNFLMKTLKGVPKSRIYRALRKGEVRVNKKRIKAEYRLCDNDQVRIPPLRTRQQVAQQGPSEQLRDLLLNSIIYEDEGLVIINKPSGLAAHGGTGISIGVLEAMRHLGPEYSHLGLAHRIDRGTSGCMVLAKNRIILNEIQDLFRARSVKKNYLCLLKGELSHQQWTVDQALLAHRLNTAERHVHVDPEGKPAITHFQLIKQLQGCALVMASPITGRMHQIRVHAEYIGHPIAGDEKYGDKAFNKRMQSIGLKRMFLHAASIQFQLPSTDKDIETCACMDQDLISLLQYCYTL